MHGTSRGQAAMLRDAGIVEANAAAWTDGDCDSNLFAQFARHSGNALWIADGATGCFHYLNPAAARIWAAALSGLDQWIARVHPGDRDRVARQRAQVAAGEAQRLSYRLCDGANVRQFRETSFLIPAEGHSGARVAGIVEDVSADMPTYLIDRAGQGGFTAAALRGAGLPYKHFRPDEFLRVADSLLGGCAIIDLDGLAKDQATYLRALKARAPNHALIPIGGPNSTQADTIGAMKAGAIDYLLYPPSAVSIAAAIAAAQASRPLFGGSLAHPQGETADRLSRLPRREHEVLAGLMSGGTNKTIGRQLGISPRTVEVHRAHLMDRMNVRTLTDLIRVAIAAGFQPGAPALAD